MELGDRVNTKRGSKIYGYNPITGTRGLYNENTIGEGIVIDEYTYSEYYSGKDYSNKARALRENIRDTILLKINHNKYNVTDLRKDLEHRLQIMDDEMIDNFADANEALIKEFFAYEDIKSNTAEMDGRIIVLLKELGVSTQPEIEYRKVKYNEKYAEELENKMKGFYRQVSLRDVAIKSKEQIKR